jgi:hypothetical protein
VTGYWSNGTSLSRYTSALNDFASPFTNIQYIRSARRSMIGLEAYRPSASHLLRSQEMTCRREMAVWGCNKRDDGWGGCVGGQLEAGILERCGRFRVLWFGFCVACHRFSDCSPCRIHLTFFYQVNLVPRRHFRRKSATRCSLHPTHSPTHVHTSPHLSGSIRRIYLVSYRIVIIIWPPYVTSAPFPSH